MLDFDYRTLLSCIYETLEICCFVTCVSLICGFCLAHLVFKRTHKILLTPILGMSRFTFTMPPLVLVGLFIPLLANSYVFSFGKEFVIVLLVFVFIPYCALKIFEIYEKIWSHPRFIHCDYLRLSRINRFIHCEWPLLRDVMLSLVKQVFIFSSLSFSAVVLGGGGDVKTLVFHLYQCIEIAQFDENFLLFLAAQVLITTSISFVCRSLSTKDMQNNNQQQVKMQNFKNPSQYFMPPIFCAQSRTQSILRQTLAALVLIVLCLPFLMAVLHVASEVSIDFLNAYIWSTLFLSVSLSTLIVVITFLFASILFMSSKNKHRVFAVNKIAEACASIPKIIYVGIGLWVLFHGFQQVDENMIMFTLTFFIAYWGYTFIHLSPFWCQFYGRFQQQACFLRLSKRQMVYLCWRETWIPMMTHICELAAFVAGNLSITLFLLPNTIPFLSIEMYEAMVNFDINRASVALVNLCFVLLFIGNIPVLIQVTKRLMPKLKFKLRRKQHGFGL